jgi:chemotaxis-related protein WspD
MTPLLEPIAGTPAAVNDCWNTIGIGGDRSCPKLGGLIHCRNCHVYMDAAIQILESRAVSFDAREQTSIPERRLTAASSVIGFRLATEYLALPTACIEEITRECAVQNLPHRRSKLPVGLVNIRGEILLFVDLAQLLGIERPAGAAESKGALGRYIVFGIGGSRFVFRADEVCQVLSYCPEDLIAPPATLSASTFTRGLLKHSDGMIACLIVERLVEALNREIA